MREYGGRGSAFKGGERDTGEVVMGSQKLDRRQGTLVLLSLLFIVLWRKHRTSAKKKSQVGTNLMACSWGTEMARALQASFRTLSHLPPVGGGESSACVP